MRRRLLIAVVALLVLIAVGWLLLPHRTGETPEVRLLGTDYHSPYVHAEPPLSGGSVWVTGLPPSQWTAKFEIRGPKGSGILLTNGPFGVEVLDANGDCLGTGTCSVAAKTIVVGTAPDGSVGVTSTYYNKSRPFSTVERPELPIPPQARSVRFTVGFRGPTQQERLRAAFVKGKPRVPPLVEKVARLLPSKEYWLVHHAEVQLPQIPYSYETQNQTLHTNRRPAPLIEPAGSNSLLDGLF